MNTGEELLCSYKLCPKVGSLTGAQHARISWHPKARAAKVSSLIHIALMSGWCALVWPTDEGRFGLTKMKREGRISAWAALPWTDFETLFFQPLPLFSPLLRSFKCFVQIFAETTALVIFLKEDDMKGSDERGR